MESYVTHIETAAKETSIKRGALGTSKRQHDSRKLAQTRIKSFSQNNYQKTNLNPNIHIFLYR